MKGHLIVLAALMLCGPSWAEEAPNAAIELASGVARSRPAVPAEASAPEVLSACRAMLPVRPVELTGSLILRNRKGIVSSEHDYRLVMRRGGDVSLLTVRLLERGARS